MNQSALGRDVLLGCLGGPEELRRIRETRMSGMLLRLWRRFEGALPKDAAKSWGGVGLGDLAFAAAVTGREDWAATAINAALGIAHQPHWLHHESGCAQLYTMHHVHELCLVADWLWPLLNSDQREGLLSAVIAKGIENLSPSPEGVRDEDGQGHLLLARRMDRDDPFCLHPRPAQVNNWDLWFASGLFMAACIAERAWLRPDPAWPALEWGHYYQTGYELDQSRIDRWKSLARERILTAIANQIGPEGDYAEGINYASYGGRALIIALLLLDRLDGDNRFSAGIYNMPRWMRNQYIADLPFGAANFNDAKLHPSPPLALLAHLASRSGDPELQGYLLEAIEHTSENPGHLTLLGVNPDIPTAPVTLPASAVYQHNGTVIWRTSQDRNGVFFATQSGAHGGAHQHCDRNNFFLAAYGERLIVDTGDGRHADPADPDYARTIAHNCLLIDGRGQVGDNDNPVAGCLLESLNDDAMATALLEAGDCYEEIASCQRRIVFVRPDILVLADQVEGDCSTLTWLLQAYNPDGKAAWTCGNREAVLTRPQAHLHVFFLDPVERFAVTTSTLDSVHKAMLRLHAEVAGKRVITVLVPVKTGEAAPVCAWQDGAMTVQFRGRSHAIAAEDSGVTVNGRSYAVGMGAVVE